MEALLSLEESPKDKQESEKSEKESKKEVERPESKDVKFVIEPKSGEGFREYTQKRSAEERAEKIARAKADLAERIALYEKHEASMSEWERKFHRARVMEEESRIRLMQK